jgi:hypothetical protein
MRVLRECGGYRSSKSAFWAAVAIAFMAGGVVAFYDWAKARLLKEVRSSVGRRR